MERYQVTGLGGRIRGEGRIASVYEPIVDRPFVHREFAFGSDQEGWQQRFAEEFGLLGIADDGAGEALYHWRQERSDVRRVLELADALNGRSDPGWAFDLVPRRIQAKSNFKQLPHIAREWIAGEIEELLTQKLQFSTCAAIAIPPSRRQRRDLYITPTCLIGAIWLLCAEAATRKRDVAACGHCRRRMRIGHEDGRRRQAKFCSNSCRVSNFQWRQRFARSLAEEERSPEEITARTGLSGKVLRRALSKRAKGR